MTTSAPIAQSEDIAAYNVQRADEDAIVAQALAILASRVRNSPVVDGPKLVRDYLTLCSAQHDKREVFGVLFLDSQNRVIEYRELFFGTLTQTTVYPREVVRAALELGAAAVILHHNHPSGSMQPSRADELLTQTLKSALALVDVRVLDHIITAGAGSLSMAEQGLV